MTQTLLAKASGLGLSTVVDYELQRRRVSDDAISAMRRALEASGVKFTKRGVMLRK